MKKLLLNRYNILITCVLSLLGFSTACEDSSSSVVEYGTPTATFIVQGKVSTITDEAIPNIQVSTIAGTVLTDHLGHYEIQQTDSPGIVDIEIQFTDIDDEENGHFEQLDTIASFDNSSFSGGDGSWYQGEAEKTLNIQLDNKK